MNLAVLLLIAISLIVALLGPWYRRRQARTLPSVTDDEFLNRLEAWPSFGERQELLDMRAHVAKTLAVPEGKIAPEHTLGELATRLDYFGDLRIGWGDLEFELTELLTEAGLKREGPWPRTVGELIVELVRAKQLAAAKMGPRGLELSQG